MSSRGLVGKMCIRDRAQRIYETGDENAAGMSAATQIMESNGGNVINTLFFSASLIIFVATVGLLAAKDLKAIIKKYGPKFIILGFLITLVGAGGTYPGSYTHLRTAISPEPIKPSLYRLISFDRMNSKKAVVA